MESKIKYRAWDELNKVMHHNFQFIKSGNEGNDWIVFTSDIQCLNSIPHPFDNPYFQQQLIIMESIGIYDCNNKLYFIGDMVQTDTNIQVVSYNDSCGCYGVRQFSGGATMSIDKTWEIIGNIYESPFDFLK